MIVATSYHCTISLQQLAESGMCAPPLHLSSRSTQGLHEQTHTSASYYTVGTCISSGAPAPDFIYALAQCF